MEEEVTRESAHIRHLRPRNGDRMCVLGQSERERECMCVSERERERVCVLYVCVRERKRGSACVSQREERREGASVCVCQGEKEIKQGRL